MEQAKGYSFFDHTADIGMNVFGNDLAGLFINSARGMFQILGDGAALRSKKIKKSQPMILDLEAPDIEGLLHKWLAELLFIFDSEKFYLTDFEITKVSEKEIQAFVSGPGFIGQEKHIKTEIKAITYHQFEVKKVSKGFEARIIFDI